jgi:hypothetical protein
MNNARPPDQHVKTATTPAGCARLRTEAQVLARAGHPGVVALVELRDHDDRTELVTARVGAHTLATMPPIEPRLAAEQAAALAGVIADLHEMGVVHQRLTADHILVGADGRLVVGGMAEAGPGDTDVDIRRLGALFELLAESGPPPAGVRDKRLVRGLLALAEQARTAEPAPSAAVLAQLAGTLARYARVVPRLPAPPHRAPARVVAPLVLVAVAVVAFAAIRNLSPAPPAAEASAPPSTGNPAPASTITAPTTSAFPGETPTTGPVAAARLDAGGAHFEVGRADDQVVLGDWDCDGEPGAALLRPSTGEIFVFDVLATPDHPVTGRALAQLPDVASLNTLEQPGGCTSLAVQLRDGTPRVLLAGAR